jgi:hypothetical protein
MFFPESAIGDVLPPCLFDRSRGYHGMVKDSGIRGVFFFDFPGDGEPALYREGLLPDTKGETRYARYDWGGGMADLLGGPGVELARALLANACGPLEACAYGLRFFLEVVRHLPRTWTMTARQICAWVNGLRAAEPAGVP